MDFQLLKSVSLFLGVLVLGRLLSLKQVYGASARGSSLLSVGCLDCQMPKCGVSCVLGMNS